jgi:hypothetical protein
LIAFIAAPRSSGVFDAKHCFDVAMKMNHYMKKEGKSTNYCSCNNRG